MPVSKYTYYAGSILTLLGSVRPLPRLARLFLGWRPAQPVEIGLPAQNLRFLVRSAMDVWTIKETLLDKLYEQYGFAIGEGWTVLDVGGGFGDFSILAATTHPANRVITFEPTPQSFALLMQNLKRNHISRVQAMNAAVWSSDTRIRIDESGDPGQYTSQESAAASADGAAVVPGYTLETVFRMAGIERVDLMKLDCEGAEYEILLNASDSALARVQRIVMEYHDNAGPHTHTELGRFLAAKGYRVRSWVNPVHAELGYLSAIR